MNRGRNGGFFGVVDFNRESIPGLSPISFNIKVDQHTGGFTARPIARAGPASSGLPAYRLADLRGGLNFSGEFVAGGFPVPTSIKNATGTLTQQMDDNLKVVSQVRLTGMQWTHVEAGEGQSETYRVTGNLVLAGTQTWTWRGEQVTPDSVAANDADTFEGRAKVYDFYGLMNSAVTRIDCEGVGSLDTDEVAKMIALVVARAGATPPMPNLKIVTATLTRGEDDSSGCQVVLGWSLQNSKDREETPRNVKQTDPWDLETMRTIAQVYDVGNPPPTPDVPGDV